MHCLGRREFLHWLQPLLLTTAGWLHGQDQQNLMGFPGQELGKLLGQSSLKMLIPWSSSCSEPSDPSKPQGLLNCWGPNWNDKLHRRQEDGQELGVAATRMFYMPSGTAFDNSSLPTLSQQQMNFSAASKSSEAERRFWGQKKTLWRGLTPFWFDTGRDECGRLSPLPQK